MQLQLPQLWLLDLRPLLQDERWRALLPELPPERQSRPITPPARWMRRLSGSIWKCRA